MDGMEGLAFSALATVVINCFIAVTTSLLGNGMEWIGIEQEKEMEMINIQTTIHIDILGNRSNIQSIKNINYRYITINII